MAASARSALGDFLRIVVSTVAVLVILGVFVLQVTGVHPVTLTAYQQAFVDLFVVLFAAAAGWVLFGEKAFTAGIEVVRKFNEARGGGDA